jgi:hypothetical protein
MRKAASSLRWPAWSGVHQVTFPELAWGNSKVFLEKLCKVRLVCKTDGSAYLM